MTQKHKTFLHKLKHLREKYGHIWILGYIFIYLPWFAWLEKTVTTRYHVMHCRLDDMIPFNEYFIIPYLLWFLYIAAAILYFFFTNKEDYYRLCTFLFTGMTLCLLICTLIPNGVRFRPLVDPQKNICSWLVSFIHHMDTCTNVFPSIHVYNSIGVHIAIHKSEALRKQPKIQAASFILAILICLSTLFLKQHSVLDAAGAVLLCTAVYPLAYAKNDARERKTVFIR